MKEVTVVIPTLCKSEKTLSKLLKEFEQCESVKEVLIFDNTLGTFSCEFSKVKIFNKENLYVNRAWNKGIEECNTPYYLLINDDVICTKETIDTCLTLLKDNKSIGVTTVATHPIEENEIDFYINIDSIPEEPEFSIKDGDSEYYLGWFIFGKKEFWVPVPDTLLYFFGDNWIFYNVFRQKKKIGIITNYTIYHVTSTTCKATKKYEDGTLEQEKKLYIEALKLQKELKNTPQSKTLSLCMIVKNEEQNLERCLKSVKNIVDEIIIIDTGSTDSTKTIASKYTKQVFNYQWKNDFADARNYSISKAKGDWIIILDADEELQTGSRDDFNTLMNVELSQPISYQLNITSIDDKGNTILSYMTRLFPNFKGLLFKGEVHEWLESSKGELKSILTQKIQIKHYGYQKLTSTKVERNHKILKTMKENQIDTSHSNFYLAATYAGSKKYEEALVYLEKWEKEIHKSNGDLSLGYVVYLDCMYSLGRYKEGVTHVTPYILQCWHHPDFCINLALCYERIEEYEKTIKMAEKALKSTSLNVLTLDPSTTEWKCYVLIGNSYMKLAEYEKSMEYWDKAYDKLPSLDILQSLLDISYRLHDIDNIEKYITELKFKFPKNKNMNNDLIYANLLFNRGKLEESVDCFMALPDGKNYVENIISGLLSMERFNDIETIQNILKKYEKLENVS